MRDHLDQTVGAGDILAIFMAIYLAGQQDFSRDIRYTFPMSMLVKLILILGLVFLIVGQFTRSKAERVQRRDKLTNILLIIVIVMLGLSILTNFLSK